MNDTQANQPVTASLVASNRRLTFLPTYFGPRLMMRGESLVVNCCWTVSVRVGIAVVRRE